MDLVWALNAPALWSPEQPNLYQLTARLESDRGADEFSCRTGFRDVRIRGNQFELNGKRLVLNGVNRHDMWRGQGFTLTRAQQEQDMRMIKALGANYARLVHYPHARHIVELADELGLLVSEEPGYWQVDFRKTPRAMIDAGLALMERTIRRDWNSPSVFAWLLGNECQVTADYLREGKALCRKLDPIGRLVSFANYMRRAEQKPIFEQAEMDFFDQHPYTFDLNEFDREAEFLGPGKPLIFSEWGGKAIGQSQIIMQGQVDKLLEMVESGKLAGHAFWSWQDMRQYTRIDPEMRDGVLESGVVTESREPRDQVVMELSRLFTGRRHENFTEHARPTVVPLRETPWSPQSRVEPIDLQSVAESPEGRRAWAALEARMAEYWSSSEECRMGRDQWKRTGGRFDLWKEREIEILGKQFVFPIVDGHVRPLVVSSEAPEIVIPFGVECVRLHLLGQVTLPSGYPLIGKARDVAVTYVIQYTGGRTQEIPLRHGIEVARANLIFGATRINAVASRAQRSLLFVKDEAREHYQVLLLSLATGGGKIESLRLKVAAGQPPLALFAIGAERPR